LALAEVLGIAERMRSVEQCWLLKAKRDGYSEGLCRACAPHAPAYCTSLGTPIFGIITIATYI
jgi:hypothetical protein